MAERTLVWSFNHIQMQFYAILKLILKEFIKERCSLQNQVLCSYFIKTFLFWKFETTDFYFWRANNFRECLKFLLREFFQCIHDGEIRHYFIPRFNLLSVKLTREAQIELLKVFDIIIQYDMTILKECKTLRNVWSKFLLANNNQMNMIYTVRRNNLLTNDQLMIELFCHSKLKMNKASMTDRFIQHSLGEINMNFPSVVDLIATLIPNCSKDKTVDKIASLPCFTCLKGLVLTQLRLKKHITALKNKTIQEVQEIVQDNASYTNDLSTCRLWFGLVLLNKCDYSSTITMVNQVLSNIPPFALYASSGVKSEAKRLYVERFSNSSETMMERVKSAWLMDLIFTTSETEVVPLAIQIELYFCNKNIDAVFLSPFVCAYYLQFLCYHELGQYANRDRVLRQLMEVDNEQSGAYPHYSMNVAC